MQTSDFDRWRRQAAAKRGRLVLPEGEEPSIVAAAAQLAAEDLAIPVLIGDPEAIEAIADRTGISLGGIEVVNPHLHDVSPYIPLYLHSRPKSSAKLGQRLLKKPLYLGSFMVAAGEVDAMVAGVSQPTARVIEAGQMGIGLAPGISTPSSFFLMVLPEFRGQQDCRMIFADCAVNIEPDAAQLADIALASAASADVLLTEPPRVAMLSFSTRGSARHERVDRVREALERVQAARPELAIDGELQADAALVESIARRKIGTDSPVAGRANVLVFPNLESGNIAYKLTQYLADARAIGPFLQGFSRPISDLSRGASIDDIVNASVIVMAGC